MREIKFRAWDKVNAVMVPFTDDFISEEYSSICFSPPQGHPWSGIGNLPGSYGNNLADGEPISRQYELMQYTGLKDRNDREVYSDDIVKCTAGCPHVMEWRQEVPSTGLGGMPGFYLSGLNEGYVWTGKEEVIGNIYENPELLNK